MKAYNTPDLRVYGNVVSLTLEGTGCGVGEVPPGKVPPEPHDTCNLMSKS